VLTPIIFVAMIPVIRPRTPSYALKAFLVVWYYQLSSATSSSSSSSSSPISSPIIKPAAAVVTTTRTSALDTSSLMDVDREMLRMFGVSTDDDNVVVDEDEGDSFRQKDTPTASRATGAQTEEQYKPSLSPDESETSEGDEWWRDPFRLFESENAPPKEQGLEGGLLDKKKSKGTDLRGKKTNLNPAAVPSSGLEKSEAMKDHLGGTLPPKDTIQRADTKENHHYRDSLKLPKASSSSALTPVSRDKVYLPSISSKAFTVPILIPLAALSKFKSAIPFTKYILFVAMAQVAWSWVKDVPQAVYRWTSSNSTTSLTLMAPGKEDGESIMNKDISEESTSIEGLSLEEIESLEKLGFHQYPVDANNGKDEFQERAQMDDDVIPTGEVVTEKKMEHPPKGLLNRFVRGGQGRVSKTELKEELHKWKRRAQKAESEAESLQHEWSVCIQQLQEANAEKIRLQSTNKYLKEQLRDTQRTTDEILKRERQKANDEIMRIREAMVEVLDRERKLIRDHMLTASKEVRAAILAAEDDKYVTH